MYTFIKYSLSTVLIVLNLSCAINNKRLQDIVQEKAKTSINNVSNNNLIVKINKTINSKNECNQIKKSFIPALFYWDWNSEIECEFEKSYIENEIKNLVLEQYPNFGLNFVLKNKKVIFEIDQLPSKFTFQDKGMVIIPIFAYMISQKRFLSVENNNFVGSYKVINENDVVEINESFNVEPKLLLQSNPNISSKKLSIQFIDSYNRELDRVFASLLNAIKTKLTLKN